GRTIREALTLLRVSGALCALAAIEMLWGAGMTGVEVLSGLRMVDLVGDTEDGVATYAVTVAVAWSISGLGAAAARGWRGAPGRGCALRSSPALPRAPASPLRSSSSGRSG
ncbi:MAG: hypothetical protein H0X00_18930, partial [Sporichthya sp.]